MLTHASNKTETYKKSLKSSVTKDTYLICPDCDNFLLSAANEKYCSICGGVLLSHCLKCFEPIIYPLAKFCPVCGTILKKK